MKLNNLVGVKLEMLKGCVSAVSTPIFASSKALDEIYKIYTLLQRSKLKIVNILRQMFYKKLVILQMLVKC